jgi:hypothetical protein
MAQNNKGFLALLMGTPRRYSSYTAEECLAMWPSEEQEMIAQEREQEDLSYNDDAVYPSGLRYAEVLERIAYLERKRQEKREPIGNPPEHPPEFPPGPIENFTWTDEGNEAFAAMLEWKWPAPDAPTKNPPEEPRSPKWKPQETSPLFDPTTMLWQPEPMIPVRPPNSGFPPTAPNYRPGTSACSANPFARGLPANPPTQPNISWSSKSTSTQSAPQMRTPYQ